MSTTTEGPDRDRAVTGHVHAGTAGLRVVLDQRLHGDDVFLQATLILERDQAIPVQVLALDEETILCPLEPVACGLRPGQRVAGTLRLGRPTRLLPIPDDLTAALDREQLSLGALPVEERRHLLGFVRDATTPSVRQARIQVILGILRTREPP